MVKTDQNMHKKNWKLSLSVEIDQIMHKKMSKTVKIGRNSKWKLGQITIEYEI